MKNIYFFSNLFFNVLRKNNQYLFLVLIAMFNVISATSQVIANFTTISDRTGCGSLVVEFQDLSTGSPQTWLWDFGNGNTSTLQNPTTFFTEEGIYDISLTVSDSFSTNSLTFVEFIEVYKEPVAIISVDTNSGCIPFDISFVDQSISSNSILSWFWDFGDGSTSSQQNPIYGYSSSGNFTVSLLITDSNNCQNLTSSIDLIESNYFPVSDFSSNKIFSCHSTDTIVFSNNSLNAQDYLWDFGNGLTSNATNPSHLFNTGVHSITLYSRSGSCIDTLKIDSMITISGVENPNIVSDFSSGCSTLTVNFLDTTIINSNSWFWDFGDGYTSNVKNPSHTYLHSGSYDVSLTTGISGHCEKTFIFPSFINVYPNPDILFSVDTTYSCVKPFNVEFVDSTIDAVNWQWFFSDSVIYNMQSFSRTFDEYGLYDLNLKVYNSHGCFANKKVNDLIKIEDFRPNIFTKFTNYCSSDIIDFNDSTYSIRPIISWNWDFNDGNYSNLQNTSHNYINNGNYTVKLSISNDYGCIGEEEININIEESPIISLSSSSMVSCVNEDINFLGSSSNISNINFWEWDFGDGNKSNLQNPIYSYSDIGSYNVSLKAGFNGCLDSVILYNYIEIIEPKAFFIDSFNCENNLSVNFWNLSVGANSYYWDFGDGNFSSDANPTHIFSSRGEYDVKLTVSNSLTGCENIYVKRILITVPIANFDYLVNLNHGYEDSVGCLPHQVHLNNLSQDCHYYKFVWSDGYVGYGRNDHLLNSLGYYDVMLIVTDIHLCKDTMIYQNMFKVSNVESNFEVDNYYGCDSLSIDFKNLSSSQTTDYLWDFGDGNFSTQLNPTHIYSEEGIYDVLLICLTNDGCKDTLIRKEYVKFNYPRSYFTADTLQICPSTEVNFNNLSTGFSLEYIWDFGDGNHDSIKNPIHTYTNNGIYDVTLTVIDSFGCHQSFVIDSFIEVLKPNANFNISSINSSCPPFITNFINLSSQDVIKWDWKISDGFTSDIENPNHIFLNSGIFDVELIVENAFGCRDTLVSNGLIELFDGPSGDFSFSDSLSCVGQNISFLPNIVNGVNYSWDYGNGFTSNLVSPTYQYPDTGSYFPSLIVTDSLGCELVLSSQNEIVVKNISLDIISAYEICEGDSVQLNIPDEGYNILWYPSLGLSNLNICNPKASPDTNTKYYINYDDGFCFRKDSIFIQVKNNVPEASFSYINNCEGDSINFIGSSGILTSNIEYFWSFGGVNINESTLLSSGLNNIFLVVKNLDNNCVDTSFQNIEIFSKPSVDFLVSDVCLESDALFFDNSSSDVISWEYSFGDNLVSNDQNPIHLYSLAGSYFPTLTVTSNNGCKNSITKNIYINPKPISDFLIDHACHGQRTQFIDISTISQGFLNEINFVIEKDSVILNDSVSYYTFLETGQFDVSLIVKSDKYCTDTIKKSILINESPQVNFYTQQYCFGDFTWFHDVTEISNDNLIEWEWNFGDGSVENSYKNLSHVYESPGTYLVQLNVSTDKGCKSSDSSMITIFDLPDINLSMNSHVCLGEVVNFNSSFTNNRDTIVEWLWDFGDGNISNISNPFHTYLFVDSFDIKLSVVSKNSCKSDTTIISAINVINNPIADFNANKFISTYSEPEITFSNLSTHYDSFYWDIDNSIISGEDNVIYSFPDTGHFEISLVAINSFGCQSVKTKNLVIYLEDKVFVPNSFSPNNDGINDIFKVTVNGIKEFNIEVFDRWGKILFSSSDIDVGWNGMIDNNFAVNGTYFYKLSYLNFNGEFKTNNGELNLLR